MSRPKNALDQSAARGVDAGRENPAYPKPVVVQAPSGTLAPLTALPNGVEIQVSYPSMTANDVIGLKFNGDDTFVPQLGNAQGKVFFYVSASHIGLALGKTVVVTYQVNQQRQKHGAKKQSRAASSEVLNLNILPLMEGDLKMAKVKEATEGAIAALKLDTFVGNANVLIEPWPFIKAGQTVWLSMRSEAPTAPILTAYPVTLADETTPISRPIDRTILDSLSEGSVIELPLKVNFSGTAIEAEATEFPTLKLEVIKDSGAGAHDVIENFESTETGRKETPFNRPDIKFEGTNMEVFGDTGNRYFRAELQRGVTELTITLNGVYKRATIDVAVSNAAAGAVFKCIYQNAQYDQRELYSTQFATLEFLHDEINSFKVVAIYEDFAIQILVDNIKLYV